MKDILQRLPETSHLHRKKLPAVFRGVLRKHTLFQYAGTLIEPTDWVHHSRLESSKPKHSTIPPSRFPASKCAKRPRQSPPVTDRCSKVCRTYSRHTLNVEAFPHMTTIMCGGSIDEALVWTDQIDITRPGLLPYLAYHRFTRTSSIDNLLMLPLH